MIVLNLNQSSKTPADRVIPFSNIIDAIAHDPFIVLDRNPYYNSILSGQKEKA
ncbi:MAG: hypothetical protein KME09_04015 [Pleurocapsa minor HA4230-MV1]|jgi:hypothetical protein|nr:hypothetical protein [Pleurocapsa minor HA4230-MV1]